MTVPERLRGAADSTGVVRWAYLAAGVLFVVLPPAILHDTTFELVDTWYRSEAFNHCFLIVPIVAYLVWRQRHELGTVKAAPEWRGGVALILSLLIWVVGSATRTLVVQEFGLVFIVQSMVLTLFGWPVVRTLQFPLGYLLFAVPFGEPLVPPLQAFTANTAVKLLQASGVPVFNNGNLISIPTGNWYVADACAGLHYLVASVALGVLFAGLIYRSWWRRAAFLAVSVIVPIIANAIRAYGILFLAYQTDNELAAGVDHIIYGFVFFTFVTFVVLALGFLFREDVPGGEVTHHPPQQVSSIVNVVIAGVLALIPVMAANVYAGNLDRAPVARSTHLVLPELIGPYRQVAAGQSPPPVTFAGADAEAHAVYESAGRRVYLYIGYYLTERAGAEAVSSRDKLSSGPPSSVVATGTVDDRSKIPAIRYIRTASGAGGQVIWYWYWVDGRFTGNPYFAKLLQAKVKLIGGQQSSAIIAVKTNYAQSAAKADQTLAEFVGRLEVLQGTLNRAATP